MADDQIVSTNGWCVSQEAKPLLVISNTKLPAIFSAKITFLRPLLVDYLRWQAEKQLPQVNSGKKKKIAN